MMTIKESRIFAEKWLPKWTGNKPEELASFYSENVFYLDPGVPSGVHGKTALKAYFRKLLSYNPNWIWEQVEAIPMEKGFLNKWKAEIPVGNKTIKCIGLCFLQFDSNGLIERNEVYFDRTELVRELMKSKNQK